MQKKGLIVVAAFILLCAVVFGGIYVTRNFGKTQKIITQENASSQLDKLVKNIGARTVSHNKSAVDFVESEDVGEELPDINTCAVNARATTPLYAEIFCSPEKAESGTDGWMVELANAFNKEGFKVDGKQVSVQIRDVTSGQAMDYITSGKAVPDGFSPSNSLWVDMMNAKGIATETILDKTVGNVAGIVLDENNYKAVIDKYGSVDLKAVVEATESGDFVMGYTNPFSSSTGLNFLVSALLRYDNANPLSEEALKGFGQFQANIPFVAFNTQQMLTATDNGSFNGFIMEYQSFVNKPTMVNYHFVPFGYRHDNPLVALESAGENEKEILRLFGEYISTDEAKALAEKYGFNGHDDYVSEQKEINGSTLLEIQKVYKKNKDSGKAVVAVFVCDTSGSMDGAPLSALKDSLVNSLKYINENNYIGMVSYANDVSIDLPIGKFNLNQQALYKGAIEELRASGQTATFDAIAVAMGMINDFMKDNPDVKPMIFVLSDGETNAGHSLGDIDGILTALKYPVYTIGYNANLEALKKISDINEAASINASTDNVIYQLKMLFNASM
ncbi:MAG: VWA domain-containing protein [Parasporobacterium sp.]|nr:VWA domain-containing protein [Parasporobacterium sp.]